VKELLQLKGSSEVNGNIYAVKLQIEPTAVFNGACHMVSVKASSSVVEMIVDEKHAIAK